MIHRAAGIVSGFGGSSIARQEIGLGDATRIRRLSLWWPASDTRSEYRDVPLDAMIAITEGEPEFERLEHEVIHFTAARNLPPSQLSRRSGSEQRFATGPG